MENATAQKISQESTTPLIEDITGSLIFRDSIPKTNPDKENTGYHISEQSSGSDSLESKQIIEPAKKPIYEITENIDQWWIGEVLEVHTNEGYFVASLRDVIGPRVESVAEFDIKTISENTEEVEQCLFPGANFAFYVVTEHGIGPPRTSSGLQFTMPYIWREGDNEKVKELYRDLFPSDPPLDE